MEAIKRVASDEQNGTAAESSLVGVIVVI